MYKKGDQPVHKNHFYALIHTFFLLRALKDDEAHGLFLIIPNRFYTQNN